MMFDIGILERIEEVAGEVKFEELDAI